jgi:hypothetical protein
MLNRNCKARRHSDQMICASCGLLWDIDDVPPDCAPRVNAYKVGPVEKPADSPMQQAISTLIFGMQARSDNILREALNLYFGRDDWPLSEIAGRGAVKHMPGGREIYCVDDVELVEFAPVQADVMSELNPTTLSATRQYRILISERKK